MTFRTGERLHDKFKQDGINGLFNFVEDFQGEEDMWKSHTSSECLLASAVAAGACGLCVAEPTHASCVTCGLAVTAATIACNKPHCDQIQCNADCVAACHLYGVCESTSGSSTPEDCDCFGQRYDTPGCAPPPPPAEDPPDEECTSDCDDTSTPIIVDLDGGGFDLTGTSDPVSFDIDADGELESISWTAATSGDAFLALDLNGNGLIDNGGELFGSVTVDQVAADEPNGYAALAVYDQVRSTGNRDGFITAEDGWIFDALLLWIDSSHDGVSQPEELSPLSHSGITALDLDYKTSRGRDGFGNGFRYFSFAHFADNTRTKTVDVFFLRATSD